MADISKISPDGGTTSYNLKDSAARSSISAIEEKIPSAASSSNKLVDKASLGTAAVKNVGTANGVAELDSNGKVPSSQLPSYVDDVLEYDSKSAFPATGESGKIYVAKDTNKTYRWSGTAYVEISESLALGETSSTAYRGDRGKAAYDHASSKGSAFASGLYKITTNAEGHVTAAAAVVKTDITALGIPAQDTVYDDTEIRSEIGDLSQLKSEDKSSIVNALNEVIEGSDELSQFSGSQAILDSNGNAILDSSSNTVLDTQMGINGLVNTVANIVSWFKSSLSHLIQDSGYTHTEAEYEILNS